jgi:hypothetical protein
MDSLTNAMQPFLNLMHLLNIFTLMIFLGIGVSAAFFYRDFLRAILLPAFLLFLASAFSKLLPEFSAGITNYIWALAIGFGAGNLIKWVWSRFIGHPF